jgi:hypothetical protein
MKAYEKTHSNKTAIKNHVFRIEQRGGVCSVNGLKVKYHFPEKKAKKKKYDTDAKRIKFVKKKGNIITFKKPFRWKGDDFSQILVTGFEKSRGSVKVIGFGRDTPWYDSIEELIKAIDWDLMEGWHEED